VTQSLSGQEVVLSAPLGPREEGVNFQDVFVRNPPALILVPEDFAQALEVVPWDHVEHGPFIFRLESGPELPFAGLPAGGDEPNITIIRVLTPFVFLHRRS